MPVYFDGVTRPRLTVLAGIGGLLDPGPGYIHLDIGPGLGTGLLSGAGAGTNEVDITADVRSISISQRGRASDIDAADPVTCTIVVSNRHGNDDPSNPDGLYWGANLLTDEQEGLEGGTTTGWQVGGNCTITSSLTVAHTGSRSLRLSSSASGGLWANTLQGDWAVRVAPGDPIKASAWFRSGTRSVQATVAVMFWDIDGGFVAQTNGTPVATSTSAWVEGSVSVPTPIGAAYVSAQVLFNDAIAASELHYADDILVQTTGLVDGTPVRVRFDWDSVAYDRFYGELADVTLNLDVTPDATVTLTCLDGLEKLGRAYLPETTPTLDGQRTGARIGSLADEAAWPSSLRALDTGYTTLGPTILGETARELMARTEHTEFGMVFVTGSGMLTFYSRHRGTTAARSVTVQAVFSDTGANVIRLQNLEMARNRDRAFNRAAITRDPIPYLEVAPPIGEEEPNDPDEDAPVEQVADDFTTQATKGVLAFPTEAGQLSRSDFEALALAQYLVARFKTISNHIRELRVNALRGSFWDVLLGLGPLDRVSVSRDYGPNTVEMELHIQGVAEEVQISPPSWELTLSTTNPPDPSVLFILGTGQLGSSSNGKLGW